MNECTMKDANFNGNCEFCNLKTDCMLKDVLQKLHQLEATMAKMQAAPAR